MHAFTFKTAKGQLLPLQERLKGLEGLRARSDWTYKIYLIPFYLVLVWPTAKIFILIFLDIRISMSFHL